MAKNASAQARVIPVVDQSDPDPLDFRVAGTDKQGHHERVNFRILPQHYRRLHSILGGKAFPYRTLGDIIRHALVRQVVWLQTLEPGMKSVHGQVDAVVQILRDDEMQADFDSVFGLLRERVAAHQLAGRGRMAKRLVAQVDKQIRGMPEGDWKDVYGKELRQKFEDLMPHRARLTRGKRKRR